MEVVVAPHQRAKSAIQLHVNNNIPPAKCNNNNNFNTPHKNQIQFPLHRPEYNPVKLKPIPKKSNPRPVTTTSDILHLMDSLKLPIPLDIYTSLVKECTELRDPLKAIELHQHIRRSGVRLNLALLNRILLMHVSSGCIESARQLFDQMPVRDFNSWAVVIAGYVENGEHTEAVDLFLDMLLEKDFENLGDVQMGFSVPGIIVCVLKACLRTVDVELGKQVHGWLWKMGYSQNVALGSFLISFYGKLKCSEAAQSVFEQFHSRNTALWTSRIVNYCSDDNFQGVISVFKEMGREGVKKNSYTFSSVLKTCSRTGNVACGRQVHANAMKLGLESNGFVQCALVDLYGKCGFLNDATRMIEIIGTSKMNRASCDALLYNYIQHGHSVEALRILYEMKVAGLELPESVFNELRFACGSRVLENKMNKNAYRI